MEKKKEKNQVAVLIIILKRKKIVEIGCHRNSKVAIGVVNVTNNVGIIKNANHTFKVCMRSLDKSTMFGNLS